MDLIQFEIEVSGWILSGLTCVWIVSYLLKNVGIIDGFWALGFLFQAVWLLCTLQEIDPSMLSLGIGQICICTSIWALRLSGHLLHRIYTDPHEDFRYQAMRKRDPKRFPYLSLLKVFYLQGILMLFIGLPLGIRSLHESSYTLFDGIGGLIWLFGLGLEWTADRQLKQAKKDQVSLLTTGVWAWSRHPNYLGDALVWWGIAIMSLSTSTFSILSILSASIMTFLLMKVSGVPLLEKKMKHREGWDEYAQKTPVFWPNWFSILTVYLKNR
jgi:steroid 5-alpha reductase family enzyme